MTWAALIRLLITFFGPVFRALLEELFKKAEPGLRGSLGRTDLAIAEVFAEARSYIKLSHIGRRTMLRALEAIAKKRASAFAMALNGIAPPPEMTEDDKKELGSMF